jgi:hypothetical protein
MAQVAAAQGSGRIIDELWELAAGSQESGGVVPRRASSADLLSSPWFFCVATAPVPGLPPWCDSRITETISILHDNQSARQQKLARN